MAAKNISLEKVPCIEMNVSDNEAMELALIENMQRKNLDVFEEADGLKALSETYGYNHEQIAKKIGKARSTITEVIAISKIPKELRTCGGSNPLGQNHIFQRDGNSRKRFDPLLFCDPLVSFFGLDQRQIGRDRNESLKNIVSIVDLIQENLS